MVCAMIRPFSPSAEWSTAKPLCFRPLTTKEAIFLSSSTTRIRMEFKHRLSDCQLPIAAKWIRSRRRSPPAPRCDGAGGCGDVLKMISRLCSRPRRRSGCRRRSRRGAGWSCRSASRSGGTASSAFLTGLRLISWITSPGFRPASAAAESGFDFGHDRAFDVLRHFKLLRGLAHRGRRRPRR